MSATEFTIDIFQNEYLPDRAREVNAVVTVTAAGSAAGVPTAAATAAEIIIVDCSASMAWKKLRQARRAAAAAIDIIRDGTAFAVVAGADQAWSLYPSGGLAIAGARTKEAAKQSVGRLRTHGGTAIGQWLRLARELFATREDTLRHAILLTDGQNVGESPADLAAAIELCVGVFRCDCRGVGTDWEVDELRNIATALLGSVDIVPDPAGLAADFEAMMQASMAKEIADVALRIWTPQHAKVRFVRQVAPTVEDLTVRRAQVASQADDYPTGAWGTESRDYHLCVEVEPGTVGQEILAARVSLILNSASGPQTLGQGLVRAIWTDEEALSTRINRHVAHYTGQAELAQAIQDGLEARKAGDEDTATARLGRAVALAYESGNEDTAHLLAKVVDVIDPATGIIRLKAKVADADEMTLDTRSTKTVRARK